MPFKVKYTFDYENDPTPKQRLKVAKECEKNLKMNVKKYKPLERQILYTNHVLIISIVYEGVHIHNTIDESIVQD